MNQISAQMKDLQELKNLQDLKKRLIVNKEEKDQPPLEDHSNKVSSFAIKKNR